MGRITNTIISAVIIGILLIPLEGQGRNSSEWRFEFTPYLWASGASIDAATLSGYSASADLDFQDVLDLAEMAMMFRYESWFGNWGFIMDGMFMDLGASGRLETVAPTLGLDLDFQQATLDFAGSYSFDIPLGSDQPSSTWMDRITLAIEPIGGIRYVFLKQQLDFSAVGPLIGETSQGIGDEDEWFELFLGGRVKSQITKRLTLAVRGDVGGFGIGEASNLTWNLVVGGDYRFWKWASVKAGYRFNSIDYEKGSGNEKFGLDAQYGGPALALSLHF